MDERAIRDAATAVRERSRRLKNGSSNMNTNLNTDIRELTSDELDSVAGGNGAVIGFVVAYLATKVLDEVAPEFKVVDKIKTMITQK